jgi:hypothetical protein
VPGVIKSNQIKSQGQTHAPKEIGEARIGAQAVESWIDFQARQQSVVRLICLIEPLEGLIFIA